MERSRSSLTVLDEVRLEQERLAKRVDHAPRFSTFDDWHFVGAVGEPAFGAGWSNFNAIPDEMAAYWKDSAGIVRLRGIVIGGTGTIFTLPAGYRPNGSRRFVVAGDNAFARITVAATGIVSLVSGTATSFLTLDAANFRGEA
jgi:hypothetical protein